MAKEPKKALRIWNVTTGLLILPTGDEVAPGESAPLSAELAENEGVLSWIKDGLATTEEPVRVTLTVPAEAALAEAQAAQAEAEVAKAERDAALAEVDRLKAELAAAQQPKE